MARSDSIDNLLAALRGTRVAVTGASGFVGSHLVRTLVRTGAHVTALYPEPEAPRLAGMDSSCDRAAFDLLDPKQARLALCAARPDIVFHLAAYGVQRRDRDLQKAVAANVGGAVAVVEGAAEAHARVVVQIGTSAEYGGGDQAMTEDGELRPASTYGATKAAAMLLGRTRAHELGVRWVGLRPFVAFGPSEDESKLVPYVITRALAGEPVVTTGGEQVRDFVFVEDLVLAMALAAATDLPDGEIINLGSGVGTTVAHVVRSIASLVGGADMRFGERSLSVDDVPRQVADVTKQRALLPAWRPTTSVEEGIRRTVEWYTSASAVPMGTR